MQKWKKNDITYNVNNIHSWADTHAMMPCVYHKEEDKFLIFFSPRDSQNQSRPASILLNMSTFEFSEFSPKPLLELGTLGAYDDSGVMPTSLVKDGNETYMYYNGWTLGKKIPFWSFNGIAISKDNARTFTKLSKGPKALFRNHVDPYSTFAPFVIKEGKVWHMWYVSCTKWEYDNNTPKHYYHIKYASSEDGVSWIRKGKVCIDFKSELEYAIARPMVIKENDTYKMWYSYRGSLKADTYRIGYAESENGLDWTRKDEEVGLDVSENGWDSEMICYPFVFDHKGKRYMLYNGNGYGKTGFGLAVLEQD